MCLPVNQEIKNYSEGYSVTFPVSNRIIGIVYAILFVGAGFVIRRVANKKIGLLRGNDHWKSAFYINNGFNIRAYVDISTLDANGSGKAFFYSYKSKMQHYLVSSIITACTTMHAASSVVYNTIRTIVIPFYIMSCLTIEAGRERPLFEGQRFFKWSDIPKEMAKSVLRAVKAPFYATAEIFAALYSLVDPLNGRKLGAAIELDWNEGVPRPEGWWSIHGPQKDWKLEGGGGPEKLGRNGFYFAGCWTPMGIVHYKEGEIKKATTAGGNPVQIHVYTNTLKN